MVVINYQAIVLQKGKEIVEIWENEVTRHHMTIPDGKIEEEVDWIIDTGKYITSTMVYHRTLETAWHVNTLVGKLQVEAVEDRTRRQFEAQL